MTIGFWKTQKAGFSVTHHAGLTEEQVKFLQSVKAGDKLCLYENTEKFRNGSDFTLKIFMEAVKNG